MKKITYAGISSSSSFATARENLKELAEVDISISHIQRLTIRIAKEYDQQDCESTLANWDKEWITGHDGDTQQVACISVDGGRTQIREEHCGPGVHNPAWIETKVACFQLLQSPELCDDPHPDLPNIFKDKTTVKNIVEGVKKTGQKKGEMALKLVNKKVTMYYIFNPKKQKRARLTSQKLLRSMFLLILIMRNLLVMLCITKQINSN